VYFIEALYATDNMKKAYTNYRFVTVSTDAKIYTYNKRFKADKIIVSEKNPLRNKGQGIEQYYTEEQLADLISKILIYCPRLRM